MTKSHRFPPVRRLTTRTGPLTAIPFAALLIVIVVLLTAYSGGSTDVPGGQNISSGSQHVNLVAYATPKPGFDAIIPAFRDTPEGRDIGFSASYGASGDQSRKVARHVPADVVNMSVEPDITRLVKANVVDKDWKKQSPNGTGVPFGSVVVLVVRKGNPKNIRTWDDLVRDDVKLVFPNPKTSGNARYSYLGAWLYANEKFKGDDAQTRAFVGKLLKNVESFPTGGRGATVAFAQNSQGDALLTFESEVNNIAKGDEFKAQGFEVVVPPVSVLAEFPVAVVDKVADEKGTRKVAEAYLQFQYSPAIQKLLTDFNYRVHDPEAVKAAASRFPAIRLINPQEVLGSWDQTTKPHFAANGVLDQLLGAGR